MSYNLFQFDADDSVKLLKGKNMQEFIHIVTERPKRGKQSKVIHVDKQAAISGSKFIKDLVKGHKSGPIWLEMKIGNQLIEILKEFLEFHNSTAMEEDRRDNWNGDFIHKHSEYLIELMILSSELNIKELKKAIYDELEDLAEGKKGAKFVRTVEEFTNRRLPKEVKEGLMDPDFLEVLKEEAYGEESSDSEDEDDDEDEEEEEVDEEDSMKMIAEQGVKIISMLLKNRKKNNQQQPLTYRRPY